MSKKDKMIERIKSLDKGIRKDEIIKVMKSYGYEMRFPNKGSSHATFRKKNRKPVTIPLHEPISVTYVNLVKEVIELEEKENEGNE